MIELKDIQGNKLLSVPITQSCQKVEELMVADYIQLSWDSNLSDEIPLGAYIEYNGERYSLLEPYNPTQKNESDYTYTPKFESRVRAWGKKPFFFYSGESKEPDWTLTSNPSDFMRCVCDAIREETGESWTYSIDASLAASASLSFSSSDILSGLNQIADAFETEWLADKETNTIYLGLLSHGEEVTLEVGNNIGVPSIQNSKEGYYTRFYAFGSTRNITQDYTGSNTNNLVNKRLTLDPNKYPQGYKDIRSGLSEGEIFSKVLIFDNVYPSSKLSISGVRNRLMYRLDDSGDKIQLGTDEDGNPIYDQYTIWYFRLEGFTFDWNNVIEGLTPSISFQSGALNGREFEIIYHDKSKKITTSDGLTFEVKEGDYEICFVEENNLIIPSMTGLIPNDGDKVIVFNIKMPSEYTQSAYIDLEEELDKAITRMTSDLNNYSFKSNPVVFNESNPNLSIGRKVRYVNGSYSYSTRVIKLNTQLDFPIEQTITIGNEKVKGNTQQLREEVASANKDLNLMSVFNNMTQSLQQSYNRTQQMMLEGFAAIKNIWQIRETENGEKYIFSAYDVATQKGITMYHDGKMLNLPSLASGLPFDGRTIWYNPETNQIEVIGGTSGGSGEGVSNFWDLSGIPSWITNSKPKYTYSEIEGTPDLTKYALVSQMPSLSGYATESWVLGKGYATTSDLDGRINALINGAPQAYDTLKEIADVLEGNVNSIGDILTTLGNKADKATTLGGYGIIDAYTKTNVDDLLKSYVTLSGTQTITGEKNFTGGLKVNGSPIVYDSERKYWKLEGDLLVTGGVTMYGSDSSFTPSTIMDAIVVDNVTIIKQDGKLVAIGGGSSGGGIADAVAWGNVLGKPSWITDTTPSISISGTSVSLGGSITQSALRTALGLGSNAYTSTAYLPLSGGMLKGIGADFFQVNRTDGNPVISYYYNGSWLGRMGYNTNGSPVAQIGGDYQFLLHSGNYSNYALPLSGGTLTGLLTMQQCIVMDKGVAIQFKNDDAYTTQRLLLPYSGMNYEFAVFDGTNWGKIWHSANDGSGSGLDADLLDGVHNGELTAKYFSQGELLTKADTINKLMSGVYCYINNDNPTGSIGTNVILLSFRSSNRTDMFQMANAINGHKLYYRSAANIGNQYEQWIDWKEFAFTDSNVAGATKLVSGTTNTLTASGVTLKDTYGRTVYDVGSEWFAFGSTDVVGVFQGYDLNFKCGAVTTMVIKNTTGNVGIGTTSPSAKLHVSGDILATGGITMYSMRKLKNVVDERGLSLSELSIIKPTRYTWKNGRDNRLHIGGIADDIQQVLPEVVYSTSDGILTMDYGNAAFAVASSLIKPVIDHEKRIEMLEEENKQLRLEVERLKIA